MPGGIGLYGGSFDPIHLGHVRIARAVAEGLDLQRVIFLPSSSPPHKQGRTLLDSVHRLEMVKLAIEGKPGLEVSDFDLTRSGPTYTIDTIAHFRQTLGPSAELYWIIGADSLAELPSWHRADELIDACRIVTAGRGGSGPIDWALLRERLSDRQIETLRAGVVETPLIDVSSTDVRARVRAQQPIRALVPEAVATYIEQHGLYGDG
ncbi:MAG: nicotinate-nucleotide adenylyltransferase [Planctomycetes bacterium]|nr:nicotinate-nucleotide adenylyltransferase [Planctomycetota bacterium]